ncbi:hypothetical protein FZC35_00560 [Candidatus Cytomitobacter indipagum]|uniref:Uncharacterized protein n=2 Tax=Candidatus Cytomitobacter indipagum TaxID=2601575 RepID=A0A5C0UDN9_9PROT|nr:hypothetical protein FZC35_00560 [Candidatus Cytomitobacter indipagum]
MTTAIFTYAMNDGFIFISNIGRKSLIQQVKIMNLIPKPWTIARKSNGNMLIYMPVRNANAMMEILLSNKLECWSTYA